MGSFSLSGGVEVFGFISPSNTTDQYPVIDPLYGIDGLRNVNTLSDLNLIPTLRRRAGMVVGVIGGTIYYKLTLKSTEKTEILIIKKLSLKNQHKNDTHSNDIPKHKRHGHTFL
jgi:hypothetical protein